MTICSNNKRLKSAFYWKESLEGESTGNRIIKHSGKRTWGVQSTTDREALDSRDQHCNNCSAPERELFRARGRSNSQRLVETSTCPAWTGGSIIQEISQHDGEYPIWYLEEKTSLLPRPGEFTSDNQISISCLNNVYKWFSLCLLGHIHLFLEEHGFMEGSQWGTREGCSGTIENRQNCDTGLPPKKAQLKHGVNWC